MSLVSGDLSRGQLSVLRLNENIKDPSSLLLSLVVKWSSESLIILKANTCSTLLNIILPSHYLNVSVVSGELYGEFNLMTSEWTDGLVPKMVRQCVQAGTEGSDNRKWIVFDGPVDAVWIENMNTVMMKD